VNSGQQKKPNRWKNSASDTVQLVAGKWRK
jgi:hypothetical protein